MDACCHSAGLRARPSDRISLRAPSAVMRSPSLVFFWEEMEDWLDLTKLRVAAVRQSKQALLVSSGPSRTSFFSLMRPIREGMHTGRGRGGHLESLTYVERQERGRSFEEARLLNTHPANARSESDRGEGYGVAEAVRNIFITRDFHEGPSRPLARRVLARGIW